MPYQMGRRDPYPEHPSWPLPLWNWPCVVSGFPRDLVLFLFFGIGAQNAVRSRESTAATMAVTGPGTNVVARDWHAVIPTQLFEWSMLPKITNIPTKLVEWSVL